VAPTHLASDPDVDAGCLQAKPTAIVPHPTATAPTCAALFYKTSAWRNLLLQLNSIPPQQHTMTDIVSKGPLADTGSGGIVDRIIARVMGVVDTLLPPEERAEWWEKFKSFAVSNPKITVSLP
jgi:hypothetical protein